MIRSLVHLMINRPLCPTAADSYAAIRVVVRSWGQLLSHRPGALTADNGRAENIVLLLSRGVPLNDKIH